MVKSFVSSCAELVLGKGSSHHSLVVSFGYTAVSVEIERDTGQTTIEFNTYY